MQDKPVSMFIVDPCISCKMSDNGRCKAFSMALEDAEKVCKLKDAIVWQSCVYYNDKESKKIDWGVYWGQVFCNISKSFVKCQGVKCISFNDGSRCINDIGFICRVNGKKCPGTCNDDTRMVKKMPCECGFNSWKRVGVAGAGYGVYACEGCGDLIRLKEGEYFKPPKKDTPIVPVKKVVKKDVVKQMDLASFGKKSLNSDKTEDKH